MNPTTLARILAVAALLVAMGAGIARKAGWLAGAVTPAPTAEEAVTAAVYDAMNAARSGDVTRYLNGYTGPIRDALQRSLDESGKPAFVRYLKSLDNGVKGLAMFVESAGAREATARVEYVYEDRNDVQIVHLEKIGEAWRIARTGNGQQVQAAIRYGTPIR